VEVVLREDVDHVGLRGDVVNVARGYARNYLLPRGLAEVATPGLKRELERRESLRSRNEAKSTDEAQAIAKRLESQELKFEVNAGPTGSLFGSVTATNVVDRLWEDQKIRLDRRKLDMQAIKRIGRYTVEAEVFAEVTAELRILVVPEGGELPPEEPEVVEEATATAEAAPAAEPASTEAAAPAEAEPAEAEPAAEAEVAEDASAVEAPVEEAEPAEAQPAEAEPAAEAEVAEGESAVEAPADEAAPEAEDATPAAPEAVADPAPAEEPGEGAAAAEPADDDGSPAATDKTA
jgi:large subunit ribosomal protein L9